MSGLTPDGFIPKTLEEILAAIGTSQLADIDAALDLDPDQPLGQLNGIIASHLSEAWELIGTLNSALDDNNAEGSQLEAICALSGTIRPEDSQGLVTIQCTLDSGTVLAGTSRVSKVGDSANTWVIREAFTAPIGGTAVYNLVFKSTRFGSVLAPAGTLTVIDTATAGWTLANNALDAVPGRLRAGDPELRVKRRSELAAQGQTTTESQRAELEKLPGMLSVRVLENTTMVNVGAFPAKSTWAIVWDGIVPAVLDTAIRKVIYENTAGGMESYGLNIGTYLGKYGIYHAVKFSRAPMIDITIAMTVVTNADFPVDGVAQIKAKIVAAGLLYSIDQDVIRLTVMALATQVLGCIDVSACTLATPLIPAGAANIPIGATEIATFDTSRITVTVT